MGELIQISRYGYLRHAIKNPTNEHSITDMSDWLKNHPMYSYQKYVKFLLTEAPEKYSKLMQENIKLANSFNKIMLDCWLGVFSIIPETNETQLKRKI